MVTGGRANGLIAKPRIAPRLSVTPDFGPLAHSLMAAGLLDELRPWVHPFFVGLGTTDCLVYRPS